MWSYRVAGWKSCGATKARSRMVTEFRATEVDKRQRSKEARRLRGRDVAVGRHRGVGVPTWVR